MTTGIRQHREDSPLLHPGAPDALVLASRSLGDGSDVLGTRVVGLVLEDGSIQAVGAASAQERRWNSGSLSGGDWTLWWERRKWAPQTERTPA